VTGPVSLDPERRSALHAAKLRALLPELGLRSTDPIGQPDGAIATVDDALVYLAGSDVADRSVGRALALARRAGAFHVHVVADDPGVAARRAAAFARPPAVWQVDGRTVRPAAAAAHRRTPAPAPPEDLVHQLQRAGCDVVVEHGIWAGEILGLEVARLIEDPEHGWRLEVGVGRHDREAFSIIHGDLPEDEALQAVVGAVRRQRHAGAPHHPLNRLAAARWLRAAVMARPDQVGAVALAAAEPALPRAGVKDTSPAVAVGRDGAGRPVTVVTSVGVDVDVVPAAADDRAYHHGDDGDLVIAVPGRDAMPVTVELAGALARPARVVSIAPDWQEWPPGGAERGTAPGGRGADGGPPA
jgi:hypothetical protein